MSKFVKEFKRFQTDRKVVESVGNQEISQEEVNEAVREMGDKYSVGGIIVKRSFVNSYVKKVKDQTGQDLKRTMSEQEIAEELVKYTIDTHGDVDSIPVSALVGGEEGMEEEVEDISMEETPAEVSDDAIEEESVEGEEEVADEVMDEEPVEDEEELFADEGGDDFESIEDEEETEGEKDTEGENLFADEEGGEDEDEDLLADEEGEEDTDGEEGEEAVEEDEDLPL